MVCYNIMNERPLNAIVHYRKTAGLTQMKLAELAGISITQMRHLEYNWISPCALPSHAVTMLAKALDVSPQVLSW